MPKFEKTIDIKGIPCRVEGDTEEALLADAAEAYVFAERVDFKVSELASRQNGMLLISNTCKALNKAFGATIFTPNLSEEGQKFIDELKDSMHLSPEKPPIRRRRMVKYDNGSNVL